MSENEKVVLALLLILVLMGVFGAMDYEDARREEGSFNADESSPSGDCSNVADARSKESGSVCLVSLPGR